MGLLALERSRDGLASRLFRGSVSAASIYVFGIGTSALLQFVLARALGVANYGVYAYVFAWVAVLTQFSVLGFETALLRFVAVYRSQEQSRLMAGAVRYADRRVILAGVLIAITGASVVWVRRGDLAPQLVHTFFFGFAVIPLWALLRVRSSVLRALGHIASALAPNRVLRELTTIVIVAVLALGVGWAVGAPLAMGAMLAGTALALVVVTLSLRRHDFPVATTQDIPVDARRQWRRAALPLLLLAGTEMLLSRAGIVLVGWLLDVRSAGIYALAWQLAVLAIYPQTAVNAFFAPTIAALHARGDHVALQRAVTLTTWWMFLGALGIALPMFVFADPVLALFGDAFTDGTQTVRILLIGQLATAASGSLRQLMAMTGLERQAAALLAVTASANIALSVPLIELFGLEGAALAMTGSLLCWNVAMAIVVWRSLRIRPTVLGWPG